MSKQHTYTVHFEADTNVDSYTQAMAIREALPKDTTLWEITVNSVDDIEGSYRLTNSPVFAPNP